MGLNFPAYIAKIPHQHFKLVLRMNFSYQHLMDTADVSIANAIGMHIMCENQHIEFLPDLIEKFGLNTVQVALKDEELLKLMDAIEQHQSSSIRPRKLSRQYETVTA
jgi:uncharacterized circularly permuted ATP-grasp superfamily protein